MHLTLPSSEEASSDPMKPHLRALQRHVPMLQISGLLMPSFMLEAARRKLITDTKRCALSLEAHTLGDVGGVAASHFLSLRLSFRALLALASDDLDDIKNGLDDAVALQDLWLTGMRNALFDVKITNWASECWHDRFVERISNAAACAELGPCFHRCMTLLASDFTSDWAQDMGNLDRVHGALKLLQPPPAAEVAAECLTKFQGSVSKFWGNLREACDT